MIKNFAFFMLCAVSGLYAQEYTGKARVIHKFYNTMPHQVDINGRNGRITRHLQEAKLHECTCTSCEFDQRVFTIDQKSQHQIVWEDNALALRVEAQNRNPFFCTTLLLQHGHCYRKQETSDMVPTGKAPGVVREQPAVIIEMTPSFKIVSSTKSLTPLSKGLIAAVAVGAIGTALYYAHKHDRLTRNVSAEAILKEQKNGALLPENQHSEIIG